ncbi:MAG: ABC transporter ATP-binding protein [Thermoactinospora sp.]|nr:ABC transporter ATP-binding protein [Thermoactinospora sp.]
MIELKGLTKSYGRARAVDAMDLTIERGQTVALLGPNGAGKSTTIGMMLGLVEPDSGQARVAGLDPVQAVRQGKVGAMLQEGRLIERVTVRELVGCVAGAYPAPMPVGQALELAGLDGLGNRRADRLSGGQVQRVRFAMALVGDPELIVLDEPTAALDVRARQGFWTGMRAFAERGRTVLFSTHYLEEADEQADRVVVIARGRVIADGTSAEIKQVVGGSTVAVDMKELTAAELAELPGVVQVEIRNERARLHTRDADATVMALARARAVHNLEVTGVDLESAFLALTEVA